MTDVQIATLAAFVLGCIYLYAWLRQGSKPPPDTYHYHHHEGYVLYDDGYGDEEDDPSEQWKKGKSEDG